MNCYEVKRRIGLYLDESLEHPEKMAVAEHLVNCSGCTVVLESFKRVEQVFKVDLMVEPTGEYWETLPRMITERLRLRDTKKRFPLIELFASLQKNLVRPRVAWGLAATMAILSTVFVVRSLYVRTSSPSLDQEATQVNASEVRVNQPLTGESVANSREDGRSQTISSLAVPESHDSATTPEVSNENRPTEGAMFGYVKSLPARFRDFSPPSTNQILYPTPNLDVDLVAQRMDEEAGDEAPEWHVLALRSNGQGRRTASTAENVSHADEPQSSFSQTLWIVQQSASLEEKRNIWLSYVNRETDATYRALGIYNLGLTLSKIVEQSNAPEKAKDALDFFKQHEAPLKAQMGEERYNIKLNVFETLIRKR